jgi:5-(carboxyamino)imidazole ribonucleotide mutase
MSETPELEPLPDPEPVLELEPAAVPLPDPELAATAAEIAQLDVDSPRVAIVVSDREDLLTLGRAEAELEARGISSETRVMSADEEPGAVAEYTENARERGIRVIIAGAGPAARLPHTITVHTRLPVIGVPLSSQHTRAEELGPLLGARAEDVEEPVAWVGLDDAVGAAVLTARILSA